MGHSLGADAAIFMANRMKSLGAPVALIVTFGPTMDLVAPSNVSQVINYYTGNTVVAKGPSFRGRISNIDLNRAPDINHLNVEKSGRLHAGVIAKLQTIVGHGRATTATRQERASPACRTVSTHGWSIETIQIGEGRQSNALDLGPIKMDLSPTRSCLLSVG
jgi:hypothetical protein